MSETPGVRRPTPAGATGRGSRSGDDGPGVPEAIPRTLQGVVQRLGADTIDRIWIFPPRIKGRRESGLLVVSRFSRDAGPAEGTGPADGVGPADGAPDQRRRLFTASYAAERTGKGLTVEWGLSEEGGAPPDRLPPVMEGVVRRAGDEGGDPREVEIGGSDAALGALLGEWEEPLLDPTLWPRAPDDASAPTASNPSAPSDPSVPSVPAAPPVSAEARP